MKPVTIKYTQTKRQRKARNNDNYSSISNFSTLAEVNCIDPAPICTAPVEVAAV